MLLKAPLRGVGGLLLLLFVSTLSISAQQGVSVQATVHPADILIGEQALVTLRVIAPEGAQIALPFFERELIAGIEVLAVFPLDTLVESNVMTLNVGYLITSFTPALYYIEFIPIYFDGDTIFSNSFGFNVSAPELTEQTLAEIERIESGLPDAPDIRPLLERLERGEIDEDEFERLATEMLERFQDGMLDFEALGIYDLKPIQRAPFVWTDWLWILFLFLGLRFLAELLVALGIYLKRRNKGKITFFPPPAVIPPHVIAIQEIDKLKAEKIWQQGREKEFYTKLTEILRTYIVERYGVNALEMTSGEIMSEIEKRAEVDSVYENLKQILSTSDLVKFAKHKPYMDENDLSLVNAYLFVNQTREPDPIEKKEAPNPPQEEPGAGTDEKVN